MPEAASIIIQLPGYPFNNLASAETFAALRALVSTSFVNGQDIIVDAGTTAGDGLGGVFSWSAASLETDDGATIIKPTDKTGLQAGRWLAANVPGFLQAGTGAVARTAQAKMRDTVSVKDYGAVGDGVTNDAAAIGLAIAAAVAAGAELVFLDGTYAHATTLPFGSTDLCVRALGPVTLKHTGAGKAVSLDGGAAGSGIMRVRFLGFVIQGNVNTTDALYLRACHHAIIEAKVKTACTTGLRSEWGVCNEIRFTCSVNEGAFTTTPTTGIWLDKRGVGEETAYCSIHNPIVEGTVTGMVLSGTLGNMFFGGTFEACATGIYGGGAKNNKFFGTDFEANSANDIVLDLASNSNEFYGVDSGGTLRVTSGNDNLFVGGQYETMIFTAGSNNALANLRYNRNGSGGLTETVTVRKTSVLNVGGGVWRQNTGTYSPEAYAAVTPGASPYLYTNAKTYPLELFVNGGTVSQVTFKRGALEAVKSAATDTSVMLEPGDACRITYSVVPTVSEVPRA